MYILTIVFLMSQVSIDSLYSTKDDCERAAQRALAVSQGPQAVQTARCVPAKERGQVRLEPE